MGRRLSIVNGSGTVGPSTYAIKTSMNFNLIYIFFGKSAKLLSILQPFPCAPSLVILTS